MDQVQTVDEGSVTGPGARAPMPAWMGALRYLSRRALALLLMVVVAVYLTIVVANMGGFVDEVVKANIRLAIGMQVQGGWLKGVPTEERMAIIEEVVQGAEIAQGLDEPLLARSARWLWRALTLDWGESKMRAVRLGGVMTREVKALVLDALPRTLLLFGLANVLVFIVSVAWALPLSRRHGGRTERLVALLAPLSAAPPWVYGLLLAVVTFQIPGLRFLTGRLAAWPDELT